MLLYDNDICAYIHVCVDDVYDEGEDLSEELKGVEHTRGGGLLLRMDIPEVFYKYIIGRQGKTKNSIEKDTGCRIRIPGRGRTGDVSECTLYSSHCSDVISMLNTLYT